MSDASAEGMPERAEGMPERAEGAGAAAEQRVVSFRVVSVESILFDLAESAPEVHLMETEAPFRYLSIPVGLPEAQALYRAVNELSSRRPGTHELMGAILSRLQVDVIAARIVREQDGVFYAELDLMSPRGREVFDARTSDALILAARQRVPAPILCNEELLRAD